MEDYPVQGEGWGAWWGEEGEQEDGRVGELWLSGY